MGFALSFFLLITSSYGLAWGTKGHETIEIVAAHLMPQNPLSELLRRNMESVKFLSMTPDLAWKHGPVPHPLEAGAHFFDFDFYSPRGGDLNPNISFYLERAGKPEVLAAKGTGPWRMEQMTVLLIQTLKKPRVGAREIIQVAATLGHYVGDMGNPLHVATDFNGAQIGERGLHAFFESDTVDTISFDVLVPEVTKEALLVLNRIPNAIRPVIGGFKLAEAAHAQSAIVLRDAKELGMTAEAQERFKPIIVKTLSLSAAVLAKIWNNAYELAGSPNIPTDEVGSVPVPDWVPVDYIPGLKAE
jgi:hypothetical protein